MKPDIERFMGRVERQEESPEANPRLSPCWLWTGGRDPNGYGRLDPPGSQAKGAPRQLVGAHRYFYAEMVGPIPDGLVLDHLCRTPLCVNPSHLEPVTIKENTLRGDGPTAVNAAKSHCLNGHPLFGDNLKIEANGGRRCKECRNQRARARYAARNATPVVLVEDGES